LIDYSFLDQESVNIRLADGNEIVALVLKKKGVEGKDSPCIIAHHGITGNQKRMLRFACPLAMRGYLMVIPDARGHGQSKKLFKASTDDWIISEDAGILHDLRCIVDYAVSRDDVDASRLGMIGHSMGAVISLTTGLVDERIKLIIAMSPYYSFVDLLEARRGKRIFSEEWFSKNVLRAAIHFGKFRELNEQISPKFYFKKIPREKAIEKIRLVHAKDDHIALFEESAVKIQEDLKLPDENVFFLEKGDHPLRGQETTILMKMLDWLKEGLR
jgi:dipeptidyl aminopeptidase/acylaminoacyl peptidase